MTQEKLMSRRDRNLADIRERAVPVAEQMIFEDGIDVLSARRLASDIGVSVGSLYNAFGDLDEVVRAVIAKSAVMLSDTLHQAVEAAEADRRARVVALGEAYLKFALAEPQRWWLMFEYKSNHPLDQKAQDFQLGLLELLVNAGEGDFASEKHRQFFLLLWASVHGLVSLACRPMIVGINPEAAQAYIGKLVDAGFSGYTLE